MDASATCDRKLTPGTLDDRKRVLQRAHLIIKKAIRLIHELDSIITDRGPKCTERGLGCRHLALFVQQAIPSHENGFLKDVQAILHYLNEHDVGGVSRSDGVVRVRPPGEWAGRPLRQMLKPLNWASTSSPCRVLTQSVWPRWSFRADNDEIPVNSGLEYPSSDACYRGVCPQDLHFHPSHPSIKEEFVIRGKVDAHKILRSRRHRRDLPEPPSYPRR